ncbi:MAG: fatty acid hydroxylase [Deltaproteobacteria bacterium]|nr:fatty acid hydroxylase [Deltaproteobacteria bacterium]
MPRWLEAPLAVALMDYTLYLWHVLMHRSSWLWRLHLPHHVDLDLDASTALRFHFSELVVSIAWRAGQVVLIGVSPRAYSAWQKLLMFSILFHHSNVELRLSSSVGSAGLSLRRVCTASIIRLFATKPTRTGRAD